MNSEANKKLLEDIRTLKSEHPNWGYRRVWAFLRRHQYKGAKINHKRVYRLMKADNLLVPKNIRLKANRTRTKDKPRTEIPNEYWGIDMTKVLIPSAGWLYLHVAIDWGSKKLLSVNPSLTSKSSDWIDTLNEAVNRQFPNGICEAEWLPHLVSDNGCQPTSKAFHAACRDLGIEQIFASYSNPKGNADTERVIRTLKEDLVWPREFDSVQAFELALKQWVQDYNEEFPHSALGYETPNDYERWFYASLSK